MNKLRVYFAHPSKKKGSDEEKRIIEILENRQLDVINPFEEEKKLDLEYDWKTWESSLPKNIARKLWIQDLSFVSICDILVAWFPLYKAIGTAAELQFALDLQKKYYYEWLQYLRHPDLGVVKPLNRHIYIDLQMFYQQYQLYHTWCFSPPN